MPANYSKFIHGFAFLSLLAAAACGSTAASNGTGAATGCAVAGTKFDPNTGAPCGQDGGNLSNQDAVVNTNDTGVAPNDTGSGGGGTDATSGVGDKDVAVSDVFITPIPTSFTCPIKQADAKLGKHGTACTADADCEYGVCYHGAPLAGYDVTVGFCTKNCTCQQKEATCGDDDVDMTTVFKCVFERTNGVGNDKQKAGDAPVKMCAFVCKTSADCLKWNPSLPDCIVASNKYISTPAVGICGINPTK